MDLDLRRILHLGSLPYVVTSSDEDARDLLEAYGLTYLREEIQQEALVRNIGGFGRFLEIAAFQCGDLLNVSAIARDAAVSTRTVTDYYQVLEDTLIGAKLESWRRSPRARMIAHPKFYFFDTGVTNALTRRLTAKTDAPMMGRLFEQWIILETRRAIDYARSEARCFFWRTNHGAEVDLLIEKHEKLRLGVEIKFKNRVVGADLSGLRSFSEVEPEVPLVAVTTAQQSYRIGPVEVLPWGEYFDRIHEWI
jgi:predicted AAA+ superfamily ATPase